MSKGCAHTPQDKRCAGVVSAAHRFSTLDFVASLTQNLRRLPRLLVSAKPSLTADEMSSSTISPAFADKGPKVRHPVRHLENVSRAHHGHESSGTGSRGEACTLTHCRELENNDML